MLPVAPLMIEHRLIERMIKLMDDEFKRIYQGNEPDLVFLDKAIDFLRMYADKCHHGKEEDILFRDLKKKKLSPEHERMIDELLKEHVLGRGNVKKLIEAKESYSKGNKDAVKEILANLDILIKFYPKHIEKEDKHFFIPCMDYFTSVEKEIMLNEFQDFDRKLIHEKYAAIVSEYE